MNCPYCEEDGYEAENSYWCSKSEMLHLGKGEDIEKGINEYCYFTN